MSDLKTELKMKAFHADVELHLKEAKLKLNLFKDKSKGKFAIDKAEAIHKLEEQHKALTTESEKLKDATGDAAEKAKEHVEKGMDSLKKSVNEMDGDFKKHTS